MTYRIELVDSVLSSLDAIPDLSFVDVDNALLSLATYPERGRLYDPLYEAARPPVPLRVLYVRNYGIYYSVDHESGTVLVRFIEDQRMDPRMRFTGRLSG